MPDNNPNKQKEVKIVNKCEWNDCKYKSKVVTSTELTESGLIRLCDNHFRKLPT